jgi:LuxR family transcriptional regulator, maltose regulon positive regulatory protein
MGESGVREEAGRARGADRPGFSLVMSKLYKPQVRPGTVPRLSLVERLMADPRPIVSVVAPAGHGKATLLAQWAERESRPFAWVSVDERDNDPKVLLTYVAAALDAVEPVDGRVFDALASAVSSVPGSVVPRLGLALASMTSRVVLVLDDVHLLRNFECRAALSVLADHVPGGARLVMAGRTEPPLRVARLRAEGKIQEIGLGELALTPGQASSLLSNAGVTVSGADAGDLHRRAEGWPVGLYLAALYLREERSADRVANFSGGADRLVSEYLESEFLSRISRRDRMFLTRTAVLERMCGPLCEAVADLPEAARTLEGLVRSNLLLVPLDRRAEWYRYHHLLRDMLTAELRRQEPDLEPVLRRRAAAWCLQHGMTEDALWYYMAAGDADDAANLVERLALPSWWQGRVTTVREWYQWLADQGAIERHPVAAAHASFMSAVTGRPADAERWAGAVDRWQHGQDGRDADPAAAAWAALLRTVLCRNGVQRMRADADEAGRRCAAAGLVTPTPALMSGIALVLSGDLDGGDAYFEDAVGLGEEAGSPEELAIALCERSLLAVARGEWDRAEVLAADARTSLRRSGFEDSYVTPLICAAHAAIAGHRMDTATARRELVTAQRLRSLLTYALPHVAVQARLELIRAHLTLADLAGARTLMREVDELLRRRPGLGSLAADAGALRARLSPEWGSAVPGASALTAAELRLLPLLATHLSFPEIGEQLSLSRHTVKSEALSIYRKLGASSRSQAVTRSRQLGLLEG